MVAAPGRSEVGREPVGWLEGGVGSLGSEALGGCGALAAPGVPRGETGADVGLPGVRFPPVGAWAKSEPAMDARRMSGRSWVRMRFIIGVCLLIAQ